MKLLNFIFNMSVLFGRARSIKQDPDARAKSAQFGVTSIVYSVITAVFFVLGVFLIKLVIAADNIVLLIVFGIFGVACVAGTLITLLHAVVRFGLQCSINRRPITWVALAVLIASVAVMAIGAVLILTKL